MRRGGIPLGRCRPFCTLDITMKITSMWVHGSDFVLEREPVSEQIITAEFATKCQTCCLYKSMLQLTMLLRKSFFYDQQLYDQTPSTHIWSLSWETSMIKLATTLIWRLSWATWSRQHECICNKMVFEGTTFPHKPCYKATWQPPDARTENWSHYNKSMM